MDANTEKIEKTEKKKVINLKDKRQRVALITIVAIQIIAIVLILTLTFFANKTFHTVTFDLDGGTLVSGKLTQRVPVGRGAYAPQVAKHGYYLRGWSEKFDAVTQDIVVKAIWEYETTAGVEYNVPYNTNYCMISGSFPEIQGEIFLGSYYGDRRVLSISEGAFINRTGISAVYMLDGIVTIDKNAFAGCTSLENIVIPSTVVRLGEGAFAGCTSLKTITLPSSIETIEKGAFEGCTALETIIIPEGVITITEGAFRGCTALQSISLPSTIEVIEKGAFEGCTALGSITLPQSLTDLGEAAFKGCTSIKEITIPSSTVQIGKSAFEGCVELSTVNLSNGLETIGMNAFYGCENLKYIYIPGTVRVFGRDIFNTPEMTIDLYMLESQKPIWIFRNWYPEDATINWGVGDRDEAIEEFIKDAIENEKDNPLFDHIIPTYPIKPGFGNDKNEGEVEGEEDKEESFFPPLDKGSIENMIDRFPQDNLGDIFGDGIDGDFSEDTEDEGDE